MSITIPLLTTLVAAVFALTVLDQYLERRRPYQAVWAVGLGLYALASLLQTLWHGGLYGEAIFRLWYFIGGMLVAAYLGLGTLYLLAPRRVGHTALGILLILTVVALVMALATPLRASVALLEDGSLASAVRASLDSPACAGMRALPESDECVIRFFPASVGALTAILNSVGALLLIGGALFSALQFARRRAAARRVVSNSLIALGALVSAAGGALERFDLPQPHNVALLIGILILYVGFLLSREVFATLRVPFLRRAGTAS